MTQGRRGRETDKILANLWDAAYSAGARLPPPGTRSLRAARHGSSHPDSNPPVSEFRVCTPHLLFSYSVEVFYQVRKRKQRFPLAQLAGRTDFALFPVAGYLCIGNPDATALLYFLFFYPFAQAHLGCK